MKFLNLLYANVLKRMGGASHIWVLLLVVILQGCLVHWVTDTTTRLQIYNRTPGELASLQIVSQDSASSNLVWMADTISSGERSLVVEKELIGSFHFQLLYRPAGCLLDSCWKWHDLGMREVKGGSIVWHVRDVENQLTIDLK